MRNPSSKSVTFWSEFEVDWFTAHEQCGSMGGDLLPAKNEAEAKEAAASYAQLKKQNYEPAGKRFQDILWTGGNDIAVEGSYKWLDGSPINPKQL